nr:PoNe immunity protein domain-containing protein [Acinetobacter sp. Ac_5812]
MCYGDEADIIKIIDGLLAYPSDRLIDLISYPHLEVETISENYAVDYPFKQLDGLLNTTVDASTMSLYLQQLEHDQQQGKYWEKKFFHKIALWGRWRFEALMICKLYAIELDEMKNFESFPDEFEI